MSDKKKKRTKIATGEVMGIERTFEAALLKSIRSLENNKPDLLIGIARGGLPITDVLSRIFKLKCAYLAVESYSGKGIEDQQGELVFSREMSSTVQDMKGNILLCDDLSDTGVTLNKSIQWLKNYPPLKGNIKNIKTAVLWKKKGTRRSR